MSLAADLKRLGGQTLVYGLGTVLVRALAFFMLPLYTRHLPREEYGIVALASAVGGVLVLLFPLSLHGAVNRLHADAKDDADRRAVVGTLSVAVLLSACAMALLLELTGDLWAARIASEIPYRPYLRLVVWTSFFTALGYVPATLLQVRERPLTYTLVTALPAVSTIGFIVWEVALRKSGAAGYLRGSFWGAAIGVIPSLWIALRHGGLSVRRDLLARAMAYCLPLVLQGLAAWALTLSDRFILERHVPMEQLGVYGVGYQVASIVTWAAWAMNSAWIPFVFKSEARDGSGAPARMSRLATYFSAAVTWAALGVALGARDLLVLLSAPGYRDAAGVVPVLAAGLWLGALYLVPAGFLFLKSKTGWVPILAGAAGLVSVGLNLFFISRRGYAAAGWGTLAGQAVHLILVWRVSQRYCPIPYEYARIVRVLLAGVALFFAGRWIPADPWLPTMAARIGFWAAFPLLLALTGFLTPGERAAAGGLLKSRPTSSGTA